MAINGEMNTEHQKHFGNQM